MDKTKEITAVQEIAEKQNELTPTYFYMWLTTNSERLLELEKQQMRVAYEKGLEDEYNMPSRIGMPDRFNEFWNTKYSKQ